MKSVSHSFLEGKINTTHKITRVYDYRYIDGKNIYIQMREAKIAKLLLLKIKRML